MPQVDVNINGRRYQIACDEGQEEHLTQLADYVDKRIQELVGAVGQVGDARLLVMTSLLVADELAEAYTALDENAHVGDGDGAGGVAARERDEALASMLEAMASRIEGIADGLDRH
jgi:cell division protein ZapA